MGRPAAEKSLSLALPISRERAYDLTETIPIACKFSSYSVKSKGRTRGPYFKASFVRKGRTYDVHVGGQDRKDELDAAHALVRAELEAEAAAVPAAVGDMLHRHAMLYGNASIPIENLKRTAPARVGSAAGARLANVPTGEVGEVTSAR